MKTIKKNKTPDKAIEKDIKEFLRTHEGPILWIGSDVDGKVCDIPAEDFPMAPYNAYKILKYSKKWVFKAMKNVKKKPKEPTVIAAVLSDTRTFEMMTVSYALVI